MVSQLDMMCGMLFEFLGMGYFSQAFSSSAMLYCFLLDSFSFLEKTVSIPA